MRVVTRIFAIIGLIAVLLVGGGIAAIVAFTPDKPELPEQVVLHMDFEEPLAERKPSDPVARLLGGADTTLADVVDALDRAARDERVKGMIARVGGASQGWAQTQELRDAIARFRVAGKFTVVHAETIGDFGNGMQPYHLASAFEEIWLQPMGIVDIKGLAVEMPFFAGALENAKVTAEVRRRYEYKTAAENLSERQATPANLEMMNDLVDDLFNQWVSDVAAARKLTPERVRTLVDNAPVLHQEALDAGLIDRLGYYDMARDAALKRTEGKADIWDLDKYAAAAGPANDEGPAIAIITGSGVIGRGEAEANPLTGEETFGPATVAEAFRDAINDSSVDAIVFRVDSPGGSPVGSETVRRMVRLARERGKPVIVSMGGVAASGGYWVAMDADRIVAQPGTLTGSIGVVFSKLVTNGLADWAGVHTDRIARGANAAMFSPTTPFSESESRRVDALLDDIYANFTQGVAEGRKLPLETVQELAKGRVYTGRRAKELGLVDELGGMDTALRLARESIGLAADAPVRLRPYPSPKNRFELFQELMSGDVRADLGRAVLADTLADARPLLRTIAPWLSLATPEDGILLMPPLVVNGMNY